MAATSLTFTASATDPDGDPLTYTWQFGDGVTASGSTASHVYQTAGTFNVTLTVTDGRAGTATASTSITAVDITGYWVSAARSWNINLVQSRTSLTGRLEGFKNVSYPAGTPGVNISGEITPPKAIGFRCAAFNLDISGTLTDPNTIDGTIFDCAGNCRNYGETLQRQH